MSITVIVENGTIKLPADVHLPDGTPVEITLPTETVVDARQAWMLEFAGIANDLSTETAPSAQSGNALAGLAPFVGKITTLAPDFAELI